MKMNMMMLTMMPKMARMMMNNMAMNLKSRSGVKPKVFAWAILVYGGHHLITILAL